MLKKNSLIHHLFFLFICASSIPSATHCGDYGGTCEHDITWKFEPIRQPEDKELSLKRKQYGGDVSYENGSSLFPKNVIIKKDSPGARPGVCYHVAMREILGLSSDQFNQIGQSIVGCQDWVTIIGMPYKFFDLQQFPTNKNLATYTDIDSPFKIKHFGVVTHDGRIKSKLAISAYTIEHDYFDLPDWGEMIRFWKLKTLYNDTKGKIQLFSEIMNIIQASRSMKCWLQEAQETFFMMAANKQYNLLSRVNYKNPNGLLKRVMGLDINKLNSDEKTALMLTSQRGDKEFVCLLIQHGADPSIENKDGFTALDLAQQNNHLDVANLLQRYNAYKKSLVLYYEQKNPYKKPLLYCSIAAAILAITYYFYNHPSSE